MEQQQLALGNVSSRQFEPVADVQEAVRRYTGGRYNPAGLEHTQADRPRAFRIQKAYREAQGGGEVPGIRHSYESMRQEVNRQYNFMTGPRSEGGLGLRHEIVEHDPYSHPEEMAGDVRSGRIKTFSTSSTGPHEFFSNEENDRFRAVHDVFGHAATGRGFSRNGEEAAYLSHRQMFPRPAQAALASETRGQNSVLNYGPRPGQFAEQNEGLVGLPKFAQQVRRSRLRSST